MTISRPLVLAFILLTMLVVGRVHAEDNSVLAASSGRHVFVIRSAVEGQGWEIAHLDADLGPMAIRSIHRLKSRPEAIAAFGNRCWVVLPARDADRVSRVVISLAVNQHPINKVWFADPPGPPEVLPPVPTDPPVAGMVATEAGVYLVFGPRPDPGQGPGRSAESEGSVLDSDASKEAFGIDSRLGGILMLPRPATYAWELVPSPEGLEEAEAILVGSMEVAKGVVPAIAWRTRDGSRRLSWMPSEAIEWASEPVEGIGFDPFSLAGLAGRSIISYRSDGQAITVADLLPGGVDTQAVRVRPLAVLPPGEPAIDVGVVSTLGGPWAIGVSGRQVLVTQIDRSTGVASSAAVAAESTAAGTLVPYEIALFVVVASLITTLLLRPAMADSPSVATSGMNRLGFARRAAGLCIDLAPGAMAVVVIFDLQPLAFVSDLRAGDISAMPALLSLMGIAGGITVVLEVLTGRSLGKWIVGGRILRLDGAPAGRLQRLLRSMVRLSVLLMLPLAWPLALLALLDPLGRGLPEIMTRTFVASGDPPATD